MRLTPRLLASAVAFSTAVARKHRYFHSSHGVLALTFRPNFAPLEFL